MRKLSKWIAITLLTVIVSVAFCNYLFGFGTEYLYDVRSYRGFNGKRYTLGFYNPNITQLELFVLMTIIIWLLGNSMNIFARIVIGVLYCVTCYLTDCKSGFIIGMFVYCMSFFISYFKWNNWKDFMIVGVYALLIILLSISLLAAAGVRGGIIDDINSFISERMNQLLLCNNNENCYTGEINNWRLFATRLHKNMYDMGYVQLFYYYGIVPAICYLIFVFHSVYIAWKNNKVLEMLVLWGFGIYLFMEARYISNYLTHDYLLMTAACIVMGDKTEHEKNAVSRNI